MGPDMIKGTLTLIVLLLLTQQALAWGGCPPARWDFPYRGKLTVEYLDGAEFTARCGPSPFLGFMAACAFIGRGSCRVVIHKSSPNPACSLRHEIAHCNGWPRSHPQ